MSIYLDSSVVVPLVVPDAHTARADAFMDTDPIGLIVSDFAAAEFASTISRLVRMSEMTLDDAAVAFSAFDSVALRAAIRVPVLGEDIRATETNLRQLSTSLTTPDMLHLTIAQRLACDVATFDVRMRAAAQRLGIPVLDI